MRSYKIFYYAVPAGIVNGRIEVGSIYLNHQTVVVLHNDVGYLISVFKCYLSPFLIRDGK